MPEILDLAAGETKVIDFLQLRDQQIPDVQQKTLPKTLREGQFFWTPRGAGALIGRIVMTDKTSGAVSNFGCPNCCQLEPSNLVVTPDPIVGIPSSFQQMTVQEYDSYCGQYTLGPYNVTNSVSYSSSNTPVMTVNSTGGVNLITYGSATVTMTLGYYHSDYISAEDCGLFYQTMDANCPGQVLTVQFQKSDETALPNPFRVGKTGVVLSGTPINRKQSLRAMVTPSAEAANITIGVSNKLQKSNVVANASTGIITFDVVGITKSMAQGDATITANRSGTAIATASVSVVVPSQIATPHDTAGAGVVIENRALNQDTSPALINVPSNQFALVTIYMRFLTITVKDQFGALIGDIYPGAEISESPPPPIVSVFKINQSLTAMSTYADPVGTKEGSTVVPAGVPQVASWPSQPKIPLQNGTQTGQPQFSVFVDGFRLTPDPAISNRQITNTGNGSSITSPPVTVTITWP